MHLCSMHHPSPTTGGPLSGAMHPRCILFSNQWMSQFSFLLCYDPFHETHPTSVCRYWAATGNCYYGEQCNFLHSSPPATSNTASGPGTLSRLFGALCVPKSFNKYVCNVSNYACSACSWQGIISLAPGHGQVPKSQRPCRNLALYGYCKFQGKGCEFNHDVVCVFSGLLLFVFYHPGCCAR